METTRDILDLEGLEAAVAAPAADNAALAEQDREMAESERERNARIAELESECARWREPCMAERDARSGRKSESLPKGQLLLEVFNEVEASCAPGTLVADGHAAHDGLGEGVRRSARGARCRRGFVEVVEARGGMGAAPSDPDGRLCAEAALRFRALYLADEPQEGEADGGLARRARVSAMAYGLAEWCRSKAPEAMPGLKARRALLYAAERMPQVAACCTDPRVPLDNNALERRCKAFATGRKNRRLCDTLAGAEASACVYSLVETARANGLEPHAWLERVLAEMPGLGEPQALSEGDVARFLPWSDAVPERCRAFKKDMR